MRPAAVLVGRLAAAVPAAGRAATGVSLRARRVFVATGTSWQPWRAWRLRALPT